jgi:hypothetical protein
MLAALLFTMVATPLLVAPLPAALPSLASPLLTMAQIILLRFFR